MLGVEEEGERRRTGVCHVPLGLCANRTAGTSKGLCNPDLPGSHQSGPPTPRAAQTSNPISRGPGSALQLCEGVED
jgi:hypothetical protein